jgi:hypothetical protein
LVFLYDVFFVFCSFLLFFLPTHSVHGKCRRPLIELSLVSFVISFQYYYRMR